MVGPGPAGSGTQSYLPNVRTGVSLDPQIPVVLSLAACEWISCKTSTNIDILIGAAMLDCRKHPKVKRFTDLPTFGYIWVVETG